MFVSGILISDTEPGVLTWTGSFWMKVDVSMKNVSKSTVTSLMAVMSMNVLFLFTFTLGIAKRIGRWVIYVLQRKPKRS